MRRFQAYRNFTQPKGLVLIISNLQFHNEDYNLELSGPETRMSVKLWLNFGYDVTLAEDLTADEMYCEILRFSKNKLHSFCDSAIIIIISRGNSNDIEGIDGQSVAIDCILSRMNVNDCPNLKDKPKLVIIQAGESSKNKL